MAIENTDGKENQKEFGAYLKETIEASGLSKAEIARRLNTSPQAVNGWIKTGRISKTNLSLLADLLEVSTDDLINMRDNEYGTFNEETKEFTLKFTDSEYKALELVSLKLNVPVSKAVNMMILSQIQNLKKHNDSDKT